MENEIDNTEFEYLDFSNTAFTTDEMDAYRNLVTEVMINEDEYKEYIKNL